MLWLLRYILGYLLIEISGTNSEQILNRAIRCGISVWNLRYKNGKIYGNVSPKNFRKLFVIRHSITCKIKIVKRFGLYFYLKNYKKRFGFMLGFTLFFIVLFFLNNYVWIINVEGNNNVSKEEILGNCNQIGIFEGLKKDKIKNKYDAQRLMLINDKIAWCSFNVEGCVLTVNVSEVEESDKKTRQKPSNIKSKIAGKIKKIDVTSGDVMVKVNDFVNDGDLLVSGVIQNESGTHFVYSEGIIIAETKRVFSAQGDFTQTQLLQIGKTITHSTVDFFGIKIPLYLKNVNGEFDYKNNIIELKLFNKRIPIKISKEKYDILVNESVTYTSETLEAVLYNDIKNQTEKFKFINISEISRETIMTEKGMLLKITYSCEENISTQDTILLRE